jgi:hypothetical protein
MYKFAVYAPAERADTVLLFHLYPFMYSVDLIPWFHSMNVGGKVGLQLLQ